MLIEVELDEVEIAAIEKLLMKLAWGGLGQPFTPDEQELMARMRENRETILAHLHATMRQFKGANEAGRRKIAHLTRMVEKICGS